MPASEERQNGVSRESQARVLGGVEDISEKTFEEQNSCRTEPGKLLL